VDSNGVPKAPFGVTQNGSGGINYLWDKIVTVDGVDPGSATTFTVPLFAAAYENEADAMPRSPTVQSSDGALVIAPGTGSQPYKYPFGTSGYTGRPWRDYIGGSFNTGNPYSPYRADSNPNAKDEHSADWLDIQDAGTALRFKNNSEVAVRYKLEVDCGTSSWPEIPYETAATKLANGESPSILPKSQIPLLMKPHSGREFSAQDYSWKRIDKYTANGGWMPVTWNSAGSISDAETGNSSAYDSDWRVLAPGAEETRLIGWLWAFDIKAIRDNWLHQHETLLDWIACGCEVFAYDPLGTGTAVLNKANDYQLVWDIMNGQIAGLSATDLVLSDTNGLLGLLNEPAFSILNGLGRFLTGQYYPPEMSRRVVPLGNLDLDFVGYPGDEFDTWLGKAATGNLKYSDGNPGIGFAGTPVVLPPLELKFRLTVEQLD
ncbi:MAG: hypothetical protein FWH26_11220, partial [Oscillospiraceae bacterium]|nr:hypothetical protein [Oscillospiraceae bacterium]